MPQKEVLRLSGCTQNSNGFPCFSRTFCVHLPGHWIEWISNKSDLHIHLLYQLHYRIYS